MRSLFLAIVLTCLYSHAQTSAYNPLKSKGKLYEYAMFSKVSADATIEDVIEGKTVLNFKSLTSENHSVGFTSEDYWVFFELENTSNETQAYYLETARPITDVAYLFQIGGDAISVYKSGDDIPFDERQVKHRETIFKVNLPKNSKTPFYLHLRSDGETLNIPLNLYTEDAFWKTNYKQQLFLGVFYGLLFLAGLTYLFFFTSLSNKTFLYYGIYVFSIAMLQSALDGFIFQYVFPNGGFFNDRAVLVTALFSNFFLLKYCEHFLKVKSRTTKIKYAFKVIYVVIGVLGIMLFVNDATKALVYPISNVNGLLSLILILIALFHMRYKHIAVDVFFSIGIFFLVIGLLGFVMNNLSLLPNNFIVLNSAKFGVGLEIVFLSLSMTNLIRDLRLEKEESQRSALNKSEEISELKSYFMSNMSHELRTPINAIMGIVDSHLSKNADEENQKDFEIIKHASVSLLSNINDILDFEKIEKGELKLRDEIFCPHKNITQISNNWKMVAEKKGLEYSLKFSKDLPESVQGDAERFKQIINNVLSNAVKFTAFGRIEFKVTCTSMGNMYHNFVFDILDTGIGINNEKKSRLFDSFGQMRLNDKRSFGGVGLGLSIVKYLVDLFEGTISIDSEEGHGTKVTIRFGLKEAIASANSIARTLNSIESRILVVEDDIVNQLIMRKILKTFAVTKISVASNGKEAIEILKKETFDVILMDLQMPEMDGYEATSIIRSNAIEKLPNNIPIIAVTADATDSARDKVIKVGMNDYLTKPVDRELLLEKIIKHCSMKLV